MATSLFLGWIIGWGEDLVNLVAQVLEVLLDTQAVYLLGQVANVKRVQVFAFDRDLESFAAGCVLTDSSSVGALACWSL